VPAHEFGEGGFPLSSGVFAQKLLVGQAVHSWNSNRHRQNRTVGRKIGSVRIWWGGSRCDPPRLAARGAPP
jgi:hypothetical protein